MKIVDILDKSAIKLAFSVDDKNTLLNMMVELASSTGKILNKEEARKEVFIREKIMSTGIGKGIALPHAKSNAVSDTIGALAILKKPIEYDALDGEPVRIVFLLIGRENNVGNHLRLLSRISRLMNNDSFRNKLINVKTSEEVLEMFRSVEENE